MSFFDLLTPKTTTRQVLSLAGIAQAVACLDNLSQNGHCDSSSYIRNVQALLALNPKDDVEVFGSPAELSVGLKMLKEFCEGENQSRKMRYLMQILYLQKKLMKHKSTMSAVATGIEKSNKQLDFYSMDSDALALSLGDLYQNTISTLGFRIQIMGSPDYLSQDRIAARVRTLLFSGIRFSLLWRQLGGRSLHLLVSKRRILTQTTQLLSSNTLPEINNGTH